MDTLSAKNVFSFIRYEYTQEFSLKFEMASTTGYSFRPWGKLIRERNKKAENLVSDSL
jgi:hypothetical protein